MKIYCIGHKAPQYQQPPGSIVISPTDLGISGQLIVPDDFWGAEFSGTVLSEYLQLFVLSALLLSNGVQSEPILICQYRKFISLREPAQRSKNNPYSFIVESTKASAYFPTKSELQKLGKKSLFGPCLKLNRSLSSNFSDCHLIEDFISFTHAMKESKRFDLERCKRFINFPYLIPAPSLGVVDASSFSRMMADLLLVWKVFKEHYFQPRTGYQRRVGGFLLERLHSFLILEAIQNKEISEYTFANQVTVSESDVVQLTI